MKRNYLILMAIAFVLGIAVTSCNKNEMGQKDPKITDENVTVTANSATFTWTVEWVGKRISVVELSQNEDMSNSQFYGSEEELNKSEFTVTAHDLAPNTKYYYRFWVWNQSYVDNKFVMGIKDFCTLSGFINAPFSVSRNEKVFFSKGNLQYRASDNKWQFAPYQYEYIGSDNSNISDTYTGWIDLFGWGTSGWDNGAVCYQPWSTNESNGDYYVYGALSFNLFDQGGKADWGYNAISNGGNTMSSWRTLTNQEWEYVFNTRTTSTNIRYAKANVNNVNGVILLPDDWNASVYTLSSPNESSAHFGRNVISASQWVTLEQAGAVFLPAADYRNGHSYPSTYYENHNGYYWSASYSDSEKVYCLHFYDDNLYSSYKQSRYMGYSVRLVCPAQ